jgi:hypothetical protein
LRRLKTPAKLKNYVKKNKIKILKLSLKYRNATRSFSKSSTHQYFKGITLSTGFTINIIESVLDFNRIAMI